MENQNTQAVIDFMASKGYAWDDVAELFYKQHPDFRTLTQEFDMAEASRFLAAEIRGVKLDRRIINVWKLWLFIGENPYTNRFELVLVYDIFGRDLRWYIW